jgi:hypothetical protein
MLGVDDELRYACLELRLAIEALAYDTLQSYSEDVDDAVDLAHREWQPSKVLKALCGCDPIAGLALRIEVREVGSDGNAEAGPPMFTGVDDRFDAEWAEKAHRSMGSFLHQRTISQIRRGQQLDRIVLLREPGANYTPDASNRANLHTLGFMPMVSANHRYREATCPVGTAPPCRQS